jgi:subtilisin family serine protease
VRFSHSADAADRSAARDAADASSPRSLPGLGGVQVVQVPDGKAAAAARKLGRADGVVWAQPDQRVHVAATLPTGHAFGEEWGLRNTGQLILGTEGIFGIDGDFIPAWDTTDGSGVTIAVVDTGVDFSIKDLAVNRDAGYTWDFVDGDSNASPVVSSSDETSHGTHVAGVAAASLATNESSYDIVGGAPGAKIMALRALDATGSGWASDVAEAFSQAADHGARVVNASLSIAGASDAIQQAIASHPNTLFVAAAGNHGQNEDTAGASADYPCADPDPNVVCVAAVDNGGQLWSSSNFGAGTVDIGAPGVKVLSYVMGGGAEYWTGTSMAAPFVSAAAALAFAARPCSTPSEVRSAMVASAHPLQGGRTATASGGMIDAAALLSLNGAESALPRTCTEVTLSDSAPTVGRTVAASGAFDRGTVTWRWGRCTASTGCATIPGATASAYTPQAADIGQHLQATATADDGAGTTSSSSPLSAPVVAPPTAPSAPANPAASAPQPAAPAPAPVSAPARVLGSPKLSLNKPRRRGRSLAVSGHVTRSFHGKVTIRVCAGRRCRTVRVRVRSGRFAAKVRPARRGRVVVSASVAAGGGFKAARVKRAVRF